MILVGELGARVFPEFAMLQLAAQTGHTSASRSGSSPAHPASSSGDFLSQKRGSFVFKKEKRSFQLPVSSACSSLRNGYNSTFLKLLWIRNKHLLKRWKSAVKKIPRIMYAVTNEMWIYVTTHSWCIFYARVLPCDESTASRGNSFNDMIHIFFRTLYTAQA